MPLKSTLVKPYIDIEWDEGETIRIPAKKSDIDRFMRQWGPVNERIRGIQDKAEDPDQADVETIKEAFSFLLGDELGPELYRRCLEYVREGDPDLTEVDCIYQLVAPLSAIADEWVAHAAAMTHQRNENVQRYLDRVQKNAGAL